MFSLQNSMILLGRPADGPRPQGDSGGGPLRFGRLQLPGRPRAPRRRRRWPIAARAAHQGSVPASQDFHRLCKGFYGFRGERVLEMRSPPVFIREYGWEPNLMQPYLYPVGVRCLVAYELFDHCSIVYTWASYSLRSCKMSCMKGRGSSEGPVRETLYKRASQRGACKTKSTRMKADLGGGQHPHARHLARSRQITRPIQYCTQGKA